MADDPKQTGQRIRDWRARHSLSSIEVAERLGIDCTMISRVENGRLPKTNPIWYQCLMAAVDGDASDIYKELATAVWQGLPPAPDLSLADTREIAERVKLCQLVEQAITRIADIDRNIIERRLTE